MYFEVLRKTLALIIFEVVFIAMESMESRLFDDSPMLLTGNSPLFLEGNVIRFSRNSSIENRLKHI